MSNEARTMPMSTARVIVVDDDELVGRTLRNMLEANGHTVQTFEDGTSVPELVERGGVDLVILDVMMPKISGLEVCRRIKSTEIGQRTPVVLLTALGAAEDVVAGLQAGADEFLTKPIDLVVLEARLQALLRFKRAQHQGRSPSLPQLVGQRVQELSDKASLSAREKEVLDLLLLGRTMDEIGLVLGISSRTVKFHQANLLGKLGAESRLDLLRLIL